MHSRSTTRHLLRCSQHCTAKYIPRSRSFGSTASIIAFATSSLELVPIICPPTSLVEQPITTMSPLLSVTAFSSSSSIAALACAKTVSILSSVTSYLRPGFDAYRVGYNYSSVCGVLQARQTSVPSNPSNNLLASIPSAKPPIPPSLRKTL